MKVVKLNDEIYDLEEDLNTYNIEFVVYDYTDDGYSGYGNLLAYKKGMWYTTDLGHCSCYGPLDDFNVDEPFHLLTDAIKELDIEDWSKSFDDAIKTIKKAAFDWISRGDGS